MVESIFKLDDHATYRCTDLGNQMAAHLRSTDSRRLFFWVCREEKRLTCSTKANRGR